MKCGICGLNVDTSACGQLLLKVNIDDDTRYSVIGKTKRSKLIFCTEHSLALHAWILEQQLKDAESKAEQILETFVHKERKTE